MKDVLFLIWMRSGKIIEQRSCYITHTNEEVHEELRKGFEI